MSANKKRRYRERRNITRNATFSRLCAIAHKQDAATAQYGDLLDLIALSCGYDRLADVIAEARRFLGLPHPEPVRPPPPEPSTGLPQGVRRLRATSWPLAGTLAEDYLRARGIAVT